MDARRYAPATSRNREPILAVLTRVLPRRGTVLEVASGTGEHAAWFASRLPELVWQPSDLDPQALQSIEAWRAAEGAPNLRSPILLDAATPPWPVEEPPAAIFSANMIHISPWAATLGLLAEAGRVLLSGGQLVLYGPFMVEGRHTAPSNEDFDRSLRDRDPRWGVRDREVIVALALEHGLELRECVSMPANNLTLIFARSPHGDPAQS